MHPKVQYRRRIQIGPKTCDSGIMGAGGGKLKARRIKGCVLLLAEQKMLKYAKFL